MADKKKNLDEIRCHINDKVFSYHIESINSNVCIKDAPLTKFEDGNYYCLFHLPTKNKDIAKFEDLFNERLKKIKNKITEINQLPEGEKKKELSKSGYQLAGIWFPTKVNLKSFNFETPVDFQYATFSEMADFSGACFDSLADFSNVTFNKTSEFQYVKFSSGARFWSSSFAPFVSFNNSLFESGVEFRWAKFNGDALFGNVKFSKFADFTEALFSKYALFSFAKFEENSEVFFIETQFHNKVLFNHTSFKGYVSFEGKNDNQVFVGEQVLLDLQKARFDDGTKILFHSARLQPSWFINTDANEFSFTGCFWKRSDDSRLNANSELENLKNRWGVLGELIPENPYPIFSEACWKLAGNAENNNRFEEASKFRQMAFECERLERKEKISKWFQEPINCSSLLSKIGEKAKSFPYDFVHWLYRWTSGYGENRLWAFFILFLIVTISAILYATPLCEFSNGENGFRHLDLIESFAYSLRVMVLQRPEPFPINNFGKIVLALESVFAPLQLALLALAIRRKFMR